MPLTNAGEYDDALTQYEAILEDHRHFESEFNAGNAAYKLGAWGRARLHYERAKLLDPSNEHLQANLALLESKIVDRITAIPKLGLDLLAVFLGGTGQAHRMGLLDLALVEHLVGAVDGALAQNQPGFPEHDWLPGDGFLGVGAHRLGVRARIQRPHGVRPTIGRHVRTDRRDQLSLDVRHGVVSTARRDARLHFGPHRGLDRSRARQRQRGMDSRIRDGRRLKRPSPQRPLTTAGHFSFTPLVQMESP